MSANDECSTSTAVAQQEQEDPSREDGNCNLPQSLPHQFPPLSPQEDAYAETAMNMTLFDPPRWGWTALGGVADLLCPHEVRDEVSS